MKQAKYLFENVGKCEIFGDIDIEVERIVDDSRKAEKGSLFVAIKGLTVDSHEYILDVIKKKVRVVVGEVEPRKSWLKKIVYVKVTNSRRALSLLVSAWYGHPSRKLKVIGVTGTDGKTTTASMIYWILRNSGVKVGLVTTVEVKIGDESYDTGLHVTNPEPLVLQNYLAEMVRKKCEYVVLEVTSHGLDQERVTGIKFDISVLTNITREHLDYHGTYNNYVKAKSKLFNNSNCAVLNSDDKSYKDVKKYMKRSVKIISYNKNTFQGKIKQIIKNRFSETCNQQNAVGALVTLENMGFDVEKIGKYITSFPGVRGRMDEIKNSKELKIYVDFAHTPNALENLLTSLKKRTKGRSISVFGCAGTRDKEKRFSMGEISARIADASILTAEDPREEQVKEIIKQMVAGVKKSGAKIGNIGQFSKFVHESKNHYYFTIPERGEAIAFAIQKLARKGDIVVVCGKGHEKSMCYGNVEYPWSDYQAVKHALSGKIKKIKYPNAYYLQNKEVAVLGLGIEGRDLVEFLLKVGAKITVYDQKSKDKLYLGGIDKRKVKIICGKNYLSKGLNSYDYIFRSPGVYKYIPEIVKAEKKRVNISSATKLFFDLCSAKIVGVTGTKGKGTTSTLIYKILKKAGRDVYLAGNIGKPYLELLRKLKPSSWAILELSSFQLIDLQKSPHIAIVLNITSDHLDWHKNISEYIKAKESIVASQMESDFTIVNADYASSKKFAEKIKASVYYFSKKKKVNGCFVRDGKIALLLKGKDEIVGNTDKLLLKGKHNWENITAAIITARLAGVDIKTIKKIVFKFKGLEHRLELVGEVEGIKFYNDSFATGPQSTIAALKSFDEPITIILGGYDKGLDYSELAKIISDRENVKSVILVGDVSLKIKKALIKGNYQGNVLNLGKTSMRDMVKTALENTPRNGVVLLSPAAASFDMFENYKDRGNQFKRAVKHL